MINMSYAFGASFLMQSSQSTGRDFVLLISSNLAQPMSPASNKKRGSKSTPFLKIGLGTLEIRAFSGNSAKRFIAFGSPIKGEHGCEIPLTLPRLVSGLHQSLSKLGPRD